MIFTALSNPLPLTKVAKSQVSTSSCIRALNIKPIASACSANPSSFTTSNAAIATAQARGLPPNVDPCSPGLIHNMISSSAIIADTGNTPPESAFPNMRISGLVSYLFSQDLLQVQSPHTAKSLPVRAIPVCTSSAINRTLLSLHNLAASGR